MPMNKKVYSLRLDPELHDKAVKLGKDQNRDFTNVVECALIDYIEKHKKSKSTNNK